MEVAFHKFGLKQTLSRKCIINALQALGIPSDATTIHSWVAAHGHDINLTTVYRTLETFLEHDIVHRHPSTGNIVLCSKLDEPGHHGFIRCEKCNNVEEFIDHQLCKEKNRIAKKNGFTPKYYLSEIVGVCSQCA
jgi:Fur family ferric uptake transcriptional regulator